MNKDFLDNKKLSWKAKGIMAYMLSKPDDWTFYLDELQKHSTDGRTSFRAGFDELKKQGYVKKVRKRKKDGTFEWQTILYESPHVDFPHMDKPHTDNPLMDNQTLLSINELSIDELNNDKQYSVLFNEWWNLYDNKKDKRKCRNKYKVLLKKYSHEEIIEGTKRYLDHLKLLKESGEFVPNKKYPHTFLNGENFNDEYEHKPRQKFDNKNDYGIWTSDNVELTEDDLY